MDLKAVLCVLAICLCVNANNSDSVERVLIEDTEIARGTVIAPSVVGCAIKSKPGLYKFMLDIFGLYHNLVYDSNDDIEPQIIFYNYKNEVLKITKIKQKSAEEISAILDEAGFYKKSQKGEEVPKEFQHYPLKAPRDEL
ncbi:selenoprotein M-like isoform X2 [Dendrobates tinctorius]|uniref:selenoprotein M-like isoform X2 n=1 Tax=Dendrobates tinctorius TaxID=92724 RepID=UPI003CCA5DC2